MTERSEFSKQKRGIEEPVDLRHKMHHKDFVAIPITFSDGITLRKEGPRLTKEFNSECILLDDKTFRTKASFVPKLVAKHYVTSLIVGDELTFYESITFERKTVMTNYSETTNIFIPRDKVHSYCSSVLFEPDATKRLYITGAELLPAQKVIVTEEMLDYSNASDATEFVEKGTVNGDINYGQQIINGDM